MLAATQAQFPGYRLNLVSGIEAHNNFVRFSWAAGGTKEAPLYIGGTDFATLAGGRPHQDRGGIHGRLAGDVTAENWRMMAPPAHVAGGVEIFRPTARRRQCSVLWNKSG